MATCYGTNSRSKEVKTPLQQNKLDTNSSVFLEDLAEFKIPTPPNFRQPGQHRLTISFDENTNSFFFKPRPGTYEQLHDTIVTMYVPTELLDPVKFLFVIHGNTNRWSYANRFTELENPDRLENFNNGLNPLIQWADREGFIIVCPVFSKYFYRRECPNYINHPNNFEWPSQGDRNDYLKLVKNDFNYRNNLFNLLKRIKEREGYDDSEWAAAFPWYRFPDDNFGDPKNIASKSEPPWRSDIFMIELFKFLRTKFGPIGHAFPSTFNLYGFSYGSQLVTRFAFFHPEYINTLMVGAGASVIYPTFCDYDLEQNINVYKEFCNDGNDYPSNSNFTYGNRLTSNTKNYGNNTDLPTLVGSSPRFDDLRNTDVDTNFRELLQKRIILLSHVHDANNAPDSPRAWQGIRPVEIMTRYKKILKIKGYTLGLRDRDMNLINTVLHWPILPPPHHGEGKNTGHHWQYHIKWLMDNIDL